MCLNHSVVVFYHFFFVVRCVLVLCGILQKIVVVSKLLHCLCFLCSLGFNPSPSSLKGDEKILTFQRYVETCKFANGLKKFMKDPNFASQTVGSFVCFTYYTSQ